MKMTFTKVVIKNKIHQIESNTFSNGGFLN